MMINKTKYPITKSTGETESFSQSKLRRSIERTGLQSKDCKKIADEVSQRIKPGTRTKDIYKHTYKLITQHSSVAAAHYSLKKSILELGPNGYEFEYFISKYFDELGFKTYQGTILQGEFVRHEVDVIASKTNYQIYVECKFHNNMGTKNDIKIALYVKARWDDLRNGPDGKYLKEFYLVSNTAFSKDAITYAKGVGLKLLGINAPENSSLLDQIKIYKLFPITCLKKLKKSVVNELLLRKIILCKDLLKEKNLMLKMQMTDKDIQIIFNDIKKLIG